MFAVVIPTLQRSQTLEALLALCSAHPLVGEVVVINNAEKELAPRWPKTTIMHQERNIFVNPSWNIGAASTHAPWLAILNDDILFDPRLFTHAARWMRNPHVGIVGLHLSDFSSTVFRPRLHPEYHRKFAWGTAMFMHRSRYVQIPERLRIFYGDDWLFNHQVHRNFSARGVPIVGEISASSGHSDFNAIFEQEREAWRAFGSSPYLAKYRLEERATRFLVTVRDTWHRSR